MHLSDEELLDSATRQSIAYSMLQIEYLRSREFHTDPVLLKKFDLVTDKHKRLMDLTNRFSKEQVYEHFDMQDAKGAREELRAFLLKEKLSTCK